MKYIEYPELSRLTRALTVEGPECSVHTKLEAYSCKNIKRDKSSSITRISIQRRHHLPLSTFFRPRRHDGRSGRNDPLRTYRQACITGRPCIC